MELKTITDKIPEIIKKYRYVLLVLLIGIAFMLIPGKTQNNNQEKMPATVQTVKESTVSEDLEEILSQISGAGRVRVMLTVLKGEETLYQADESFSNSDNSGSTQMDTVIISNSQRGEEGLVRQINPETYLGAIILSQGADSATVRLALIDAVSKITGLSTDCISVLKMN